MSLSTLTLGLYLILTGLVLLGAIAVSNQIMGLLALIAGILFFVDAVRPIVLFKRS